jgi:RNA-directed DNA polymerase
MKRRTEDVYEIGKWLKRVVQGHNNYYAAPENSAALNQFRTEICRTWLKALRRRGTTPPNQLAAFNQTDQTFYTKHQNNYGDYPDQRLSV